MRPGSIHARRSAPFVLAASFTAAACAGSSGMTPDQPTPRDQADASTLPDAGAGGLALGGDAAALDGAASKSCDDAIDRHGCTCTLGTPPRRCYTGPASQAGIGACVMGQQSCTGNGEFGVWGPCVGSGAPTTCAAAGANCGTIKDGCGGVLECGTCPAGQTCGGAGTPNVCGCTPTTCVALGDTCGTVPDGCGGALDCGSCPAGQTCGGGGTPNRCGGALSHCGSFQQYCWTCSPPSNPYTGVTQKGNVTSAADCLAYCNSLPNTVCCEWASPPSGTDCFAITDPACAHQNTTSPFCSGNGGGFSCGSSVSSMASMWAVVCQ